MRFIASLIYVLASFLIGFFVLGVALNPDILTTTVPYIQNEILADTYSRIVIALSGILLVVLSLKYLHTVIFSSRQEKAITLQLPSGKVSVTLFALEDMIKKFLEEKKELSHIKPRVISSKKGIEVVIKSTLISEVSLIELTGDIQEKIKEKLLNLLGPDKEINIRLEIKKMNFGAKKGKEQVPEEEEPEVPFRNY